MFNFMNFSLNFKIFFDFYYWQNFLAIVLSSMYLHKIIK